MLNWIFSIMLTVSIKCKSSYLSSDVLLELARVIWLSALLGFTWSGIVSYTNYRDQTGMGWQTMN